MSNETNPVFFLSYELTFTNRLVCRGSRGRQGKAGVGDEDHEGLEKDTEENLIIFTLKFPPLLCCI